MRSFLLLKVSAERNRRDGEDGCEIVESNTDDLVRIKRERTDVTVLAEIFFLKKLDEMCH